MQNDIILTCDLKTGKTISQREVPRPEIFSSDEDRLLNGDRTVEEFMLAIKKDYGGYKRPFSSYNKSWNNLMPVVSAIYTNWYICKHREYRDRLEASLGYGNLEGTYSRVIDLIEHFNHTEMGNLKKFYSPFSKALIELHVEWLHSTDDIYNYSEDWDIYLAEAESKL